MKRVLLALALVCAGCSTSPTPLGKKYAAKGETLECVHAAGENVKFRNFKLLFFSRDADNSVQVWLDPESGRVVIFKRSEGKICYVTNSFPNIVYMPYDQSTMDIVRTLEKQ